MHIRIDIIDSAQSYPKSSLSYPSKHSKQHQGLDYIVSLQHWIDVYGITLVLIE